MLEDYKEYDKIIYKQMENAISNNLSNTYLFDLYNNLYA